MERKFRYSGLAVLAVLSTLFALARAEAAPPTVAEIREAVAAAAEFDYGESRKPLWELERIRTETENNPELRAELERQLAAVLESDAPLAAKQSVCRELWIIGTDASLPALTALLLGDDPNAAEIACYALAGNPSDSVTATLRDAVAKTSGSAQVAVINLLGSRRDAPSVPLLAGVAREESPASSDAAIAALGKIATGKALETLRLLHAGDDATLRDRSADALLQAAQELAARGDAARALSLYRQLAVHATQPHVRRGALLGRIALAGDEAPALVLDILKGRDPSIKAVAASTLRTIPGDDVGEFFSDQLPRLEPTVQALAIEALADRGDPALRPAIAAAAAHEDAAVRIAALKGLASLGDASSAPVLFEALTAPNAEEARTAAAALRMLQAPGVDDTILQQMQGASEAVTVEAISILADRRSAVAIPMLLQRAAAGDGPVCDAALDALADLAAAEHAPALVDLLFLDGLGESRARAEKAVVAAANRIEPEDARSQPVAEKMSTELEVAPKCSLLRVLGEIDTPQSLAVLKWSLTDPRPEVHEAAVRAVAGWPGIEAAETLLEILTESDNETQRILALRGYVRLLALPAEHAPEETLAMYEQAMSAARRPEEQKMVLAGLATAGVPGALDLVEPLLDQQAVQAEAALAAVQIAASVGAANPEQAGAVLQKVISSTDDESLIAQAKQALAEVEKHEDHIVTWQVSGPYARDGKGYAELFDIAFPPEEKDAEDIDWRPLSATDAQRPWILNLSDTLGGDQTVAYFRTWVQSPRQQPARLEAGSDDGIKVWLNGALVHANNVARAAVAGEDSANVALDEGWNTLLVKITQNAGPWGFCLRLRDPDGLKIEGLTVNAEHEPATPPSAP